MTCADLGPETGPEAELSVADQYIEGLRTREVNEVVTMETIADEVIEGVLSGELSDEDANEIGEKLGLIVRDGSIN